MFRFISMLFIIVSVYAYQQDLAKLPNGKSYGLTLGHPGGATKRTTSIASTFYAMGQTWNKAFCQADADGDGQSNGLEMGDPCCKWSAGQTPQFTTGLSDPNSATSKTLNVMPPCIMAFADAKLQCPVCIQALQLDMAKPSANAAEFSLTTIKSCKDATQDDAQKVLCVKTLLKNADQLVMDQKNGVAPIQSCMNLGLLCMTPPTAAPTKAPTAAPMTAAPMTAAPTTAAPTTAAPKPTPPPPPRATESTLQPVSHIAELAPAADPVTESAIVVPIIASAGGAIILSLLLWRYCKGKEVVLNTDGDFHALPDIEYTK
jgi:hypothetical protein